MPPMSRLSIAALAGLAALAGAPCPARELSGALIYRARIALPAEAEVAVEARDPAGLIAAEMRTDTLGAQVPLAFRLDVPADTALTLRAAIFVNGRPAWLAAPVAVPAGTRDEAIGEIEVLGFRPFGEEALDCGGRLFGLAAAPDEITFRVGPRVFHLKPEPAASGVRHGDGKVPPTWVQNDGPDWRVSLGGTELGPCRMTLPDGAAWRAGGNEPSWAASIADGTLSLARLGTEGTITGALSEPVAEDGADRYDIAGTGLVLLLRDGPCVDSMTGMAHPQVVILKGGGEMLQGCGGEPAALLRGPEWRVTRLDGADVPEAAAITLGFDGQGRVSGRAGCNRYSARYTLTTETLGFGPGALTRMACPEPQMAIEREFLAMLSRVTRFDIGEGGRLRLIAGDEVVAEALP